MDHSPQPPPAPLTPVPLLDLHRENASLQDEYLAAIATIMDQSCFLHGPPCQDLERAVAKLCMAEHAVGCASGSDALLLSLMALDVGPGDEVIVPSFTFFATASAVWRLGANPVFVDIDPASFNLSPADVEQAISPATRAIIPVHLFGQCAEMPAILDIARKHELKVVEDAAQAIGAAHRGRPAGSWGDIACFSFYPTKNLGGCGDGGMLTTQSPELAERLRLLASHGMKDRYYHNEVGINSRLDTIQAAILHIKLRNLESRSQRRQQLAARYQELFEDADAAASLGLPQTGEGQLHVWNQYTIRVPLGRRDDLRSYLADKKIGTAIYYPVPLHRQACFRTLPRRRKLPHTEQASQEVLSLPIFPEMTFPEQDAVVGSIVEFVRREKLQAA